MGDSHVRDGAGIVRCVRGAAVARPGAWPALLLAAWLAVTPAATSGAWDAERMVRAAAAHSQRTEQAARQLLDLLNRLGKRELREPREIRARLDAVNDYFNRSVAFADDSAVWGVEDHWASPLETLSKAAGDCEDYAIAKYFTLVASGVPSASLRLVYVRAMLPASQGLAARSQAHMVLAHYEDRSEDPLILDNLVPEIRRASLRSDLTPVFSFNGEGLWHGAGAQTAGDPMLRLSRWREVVRKARTEGFE